MAINMETGKSITAQELSEQGILKPKEVRQLIRKEKITCPTSGMCPG